MNFEKNAKVWLAFSAKKSSMIVVQIQFDHAGEAVPQKVTPFLIKFFYKFNEGQAVTSQHTCDVISLD